MSAAAPAIGVLIVSSGRSELLDECLRLVRAQAADLAAEIVVVINAAPESLPPARLAALRPLVDRLEFEPRPGKSHGLNRGVEISRAPVIAFTDDDTTPHPGWLRAITEPLTRPARPPELVGCGGPVLPVFSIPPPEWYVRLTARRDTHFLGPKHDLGPQPLDYGERPERRRSVPLGANCAYVRDVLLRNPYLPDLGPNRETGLRGGEDFELGFRLLSAGYRLLYCPAARVEHPVAPERLTLEYVRRGYYWQGVERVRLGHALGRRPDSVGKLVFKVMRRGFRMKVHGLSRSWRQIRRIIRFSATSGQLVETLRMRNGAAGLPEEPSLREISRFSLRWLGFGAWLPVAGRGVPSLPRTGHRSDERDPTR